MPDPRSAHRLHESHGVMPDLLYGSNCFYSCLTAQEVDRLQKLQNRAARAVFGKLPGTSAHPLLVQMGLFRISTARKLLR